MPTHAKGGSPGWRTHHPDWLTVKHKLKVEAAKDSGWARPELVANRSAWMAEAALRECRQRRVGIRGLDE